MMSVFGTETVFDQSSNDMNYQQTIAEQNTSVDLHINHSTYIPNNSFTNDIRTDSVVFLLDLIYVLDEFGIPAIVIFGVISNLILSITIRKSELKKVSIFCYFFSLGIVDTFYLIAMAIPWLSVRIGDIYTTEGFCQLIYYLNFLTTFLSSWFTVMMLFERLCCVYKPKFAEKYHSAFRTKCYLTLVAIFSIVGHLYLTWTSTVTKIGNTKVCTVIIEHAKDIMVMRKIDSVFSFMIPVILNVTFVGAIVVLLCSPVILCKDTGVTVNTRTLRVEVRLYTNDGGKGCKDPLWSENGYVGGSERQRLRTLSGTKRLTATAMLIAIVYTVLLIPHSIIKLIATFSTGDYIMTIQDELLLKLFEELFKFNFAYKAVAYFTILPEMRSNFLKVFIRCCRKKRVNKYDTKCIETQL